MIKNINQNNLYYPKTLGPITGIIIIKAFHILKVACLEHRSIESRCWRICRSLRKFLQHLLHEIGRDREGNWCIRWRKTGDQSWCIKDLRDCCCYWNSLEQRCYERNKRCHPSNFDISTRSYRYLTPKLYPKEPFRNQLRYNWTSCRFTIQCFYFPTSFNQRW